MAELKICSKCKIRKPLMEFYRRKISLDGHVSECKNCHNIMKHKYHDSHKEERKVYMAKYYNDHKEERAIWRANNKEQIRAWKLQKKYNLTIEEEREMAENQDHRCLICLSTLPLYVDHCHKTGKVRGLLCRDCNFTLGRVGDSIPILLNSIKYLEKYSERL